MANEKWVVHVVGPDDIHDMPDEITALRAANSMNKNIAWMMNDSPSPNNPFVVALAKNAMVEEV